MVLTYGFDITEDDIRHGVPEDFYRCSIAQSARRAFGVDVFVGLVGIAQESEDGLLLAKWSEPMDEFINAFDNERGVAPMILDLELTKEGRDLIEQHKKSRRGDDLSL